MHSVDHAPRNSGPHDIKSLLMKPLGGLVFQAKLLRTDYQCYQQARQEVWTGDVNQRRTRKDELYQGRRAALVEETLVRGEGSQNFLSRLAIEDGELTSPAAAEMEIPDYPDFLEPAGAS